MNEQQIKELRAHAGKLVEEGRSLRGVFEYYAKGHGDWHVFTPNENIIPDFADGDEWRIVAEDPHAESKALYAEDAKMHEKPWELWECSSISRPHFDTMEVAPSWFPSFQYRRKPQPKKQLIDWSHPFFKGCATNYGELFVRSDRHCSWLTGHGTWIVDENLRLATPANEYANWQPFFSTPENDAKLCELAKMVDVQVRYATENSEGRVVLWAMPFEDYCGMRWDCICNYRITGLKEGWTDCKEEV